MGSLIFVAGFFFVAIMLIINLSDYASLSDKYADLPVNYMNWSCKDVCGG